MIWQNFRDALSSIRSNALRSLLTTLSIVIGTAALIATLSIGVGAQSQIAEQIRSLGANVLIVVPKPDRGAAGPRGERIRPARLTTSDAEAIGTAASQVIASAPALQLQSRLVYGNRNWPTRINGTTTDYFVIRDWPIADGRGFSRREERAAERVALIGQTVASRLFGKADPVGREIRIIGAPMRVVGVLASKGLSGSGRDQDDIVFVPYKTALQRLGTGERTLSPETVTYIIAKAVSDTQVGAAKAAIDGLLRLRHQISANSPAGFRVADPAATMAAQQRSSRTIGWLLAAIASISMIVGGISIMNIMLVSMSERTREIGLRQALGASRRNISWLFLSEALLICLMGGLVGAGLGSSVAWLMAQISGWPIRITHEIVLAALLFAGLTGLLFGYVPARKGARLLPATALRSH